MSSRRWLSGFVGLVTENWLYKVVALIVAFAVWATTIYGRKDTIMIKTLNLEYVLRPNFAITNDYLRTVQVKVSGPREELNTFARSATPLVVNLTDRDVGSNVIPISTSDVAVPLGVKVMSVIPEEIRLVIQKTHVRRRSHDK